MTKVKICGITNLEDALLSAKFGADALGFNFYEKSPRFIAPEKAREIIEQLPPEILKVGVFVNESLDKIAEIATKAKLDALQLHGEETPEFARELKAITKLEIIKAFRVSPEFKPEDVLIYETDAILLDAYNPKEHGGTGETFDWEIAKKVREIFPKMYVAGGLSAENVSEAVEKVKPFAVDSCSALEIEKGLKDSDKVLLFTLIAKSKFDKMAVAHTEFAKKYFHFLESDYDFGMTEVKTNFTLSSVRYESKNVFVKIWRFRAESDVSIGLLKSDRWFSINQLKSLGYGVDSPVEHLFGKSNQIEEARRTVSRLADFVKQNCEKFLKGDLEAFDEFEKKLSESSRLYNEKLQAEPIKRKAEEAWTKKDHAQVVKNYGMIRQILSPTELKKLEYSEKQLRNE